MKKRVLYSLMVLTLVLGLTLSMAGPVMGQHFGSKELDWDAGTSGHPAGVYLVGQTVYFIIQIINNTEGPLEIVELWDQIPVAHDTYEPIPGVTRTSWWNDHEKRWDDGDPGTSFTIPGYELWEVTFNYTVLLGDLTFNPDLGGNGVVNRFLARGAEGQLVGASEPIRVIQPDIELEKTVSPTAAQVGQTVTYTFTITNTGDWPVGNITLEDDVLGPLTDQLLPAGLVLAAGASSMPLVVPYTIQAGDLPLYNTANVTGTAQNFTATMHSAAVVSDTDTATVTSELPPVGGTAFPVNRLALLALWIGLAAIVAGAVVFVRRRQTQS